MTTNHLMVERGQYSRLRLRSRYGRGRQHPVLPPRSEPAEDGIVRTTFAGSHMPLDIAAHWQWQNPLNILPLSIMLLLLVALLELL